MEILFEDNHLLVVVKPQNMPVCADESGDENLLDIMKLWLKEKYNKPGNVYLGLVHRLDRPAGGVMVFAKTSKSASRLCDQMRKRETGKIYWAVVEGVPPVKYDTVRDWLLKDEKLNMVSVTPAGTPGAKHAVLDYEVLQQKGLLCLVQIVLETGRTHQIRAQMAHLGHPLVGDAKYGAVDGRATRHLALWCYSMTITHPVTHEELTFSCAPPDTMPWTLFGVGSAGQDGFDSGKL